MKQSMIYMQTLAGQTGLPLSKVEWLLGELAGAEAKVNQILDASEDESEAEFPAGYAQGLRVALIKLGGKNESISGCLRALIDERDAQ